MAYSLLTMLSTTIVAMASGVGASGSARPKVGPRSMTFCTVRVVILSARGPSHGGQATTVPCPALVWPSTGAPQRPGNHGGYMPKAWTHRTGKGAMTAASWMAAMIRKLVAPAAGDGITEAMAEVIENKLGE